MQKTHLDAQVAISTLNRDVFIRALRQLNRTNPQAAEAIGAKCREFSGVSRFRAGTLYSTGGYAFNAAGALTSGPNISCYSIPLGQNDPVLGPMTLAETNLLIGGKVQGSSTFIAIGRGWDVYYHGSSPSLPDAAQIGLVIRLARAVGFTTSTNGNDIQRNGVVSAYPAPAMMAVGVVGNLLAGAQAASSEIVGRGWGEIVPVDPLLEIGPDATLTVDGALSGGTGPVSASGTVIAFRHWFYGYELNQVRG